MILRVGRNLHLQEWNIRDRLAPYWYLCWNQTPGAELVFHNRIVEMTPDKLILIPAMTKFSTRSKKPFIHCSVEFSAGVPFKEIAHREIIFPAAPYIEYLTMEYGSKMRLSMRLYSMIFDLLLQIPESHFQLPGTPAIDPRIEKALDLMGVRPKKQCTNLELSRVLNMSVSSFSHLFRQEMGMSPQRYLLRRELGNALTLLGDPGLDIGSIALETGFADRYHFSKAFKAYYGFSPSDMRKRLQKIDD